MISKTIPLGNLKTYEDFSVGDSFVITCAPVTWASILNENDPNEIEKFPYIGIIKEICNDNYEYIAMTDGKYGFCLNMMIYKGIIVNNRRELRKRKLNKIKWQIGGDLL